MDYRFTAILILMLVGLTLFAEPAYPRNEYLNNGYNSCRTGEVDVRLEKENRDSDYRHYNDNNNYNNNDDNGRLSLTYRHYIGSACTKEFRSIQQENMELKQQLELLKMCSKVNKNPSIKHNENFRLLVSKCTGIIPTIDDNQEIIETSLWQDIKKEYLEDNPDKKIIGPIKPWSTDLSITFLEN